MINAEAIHSYIVENFLFGDNEGLSEETSFLDNGIIDSTGIIELVAFVENQFNMPVSDDELVPENFDSIQNIVNFLNKKLNPVSSIYQ